MTEYLKEIPVGAIMVNPDQPRKMFDKKALEELAGSINDNGLMYPVTVEGPHEPNCDFPGEFYILIDGERRLRAIKDLLGWRKINALVRDPVTMPRERRMLLALVANLQRENLNPIEEAEGYLRLKTELGLNATQISRKVGKYPGHISSRLHLLDLDDEIQELIARGEIYKDQHFVDALLSIEDKEKRISLARSLVARGASVSAGIAACKKLNQHLSSGGIDAEETPSVRITVSRVGRAALPKYDVFAGTGMVPRWEMVKGSAKMVCDGCAMRSIASKVVCQECPLVEFLIDLINRADRSTSKLDKESER